MSHDAPTLQMGLGFGEPDRWLSRGKTDWTKLRDVVRQGVKVTIDNRVRTEPRYQQDICRKSGRLVMVEVAISSAMAGVLVEMAEAEGTLVAGKCDWRPAETVPEDHYG